MDYIIKKTDVVGNGQFTIKPYTTNGSASPSAATPLAPNAVSANTSLILLGKGMYEYGELIASDLVHLLENFSNTTAPVYPIQGQLWYKNSTKELFIYDAASSPVWKTIILNGLLTDDLDVNNQHIINLANPVNPTDAVNKQYIDGNVLTIAGGVLTSGANITLSGGGEVFGLPVTPTTDGSAASKLYVDTTITNLTNNSNSAYVYKSGDTMTGVLTMAADTHIILPTPTGGFVVDNDVVNKNYVDLAVSGVGTGTFVKVAGDTMTGELSINGINLYSGINRIITDIDTALGTITLSGGNYTSDFTIGIQFSATFSAVSGYQVVNVGGAVTGGTATGLLNDATVYTASILIDGVTTVPIIIVGSTAQTYTTLINELNTNLGVNATTSLVNGNVRITSTLTGTSSTIAITDTNLFGSLTTFAGINAAVPGINITVQQLTTSSSTFNSGPNTTTITVSNTLTTSALSGTVSNLSGLHVYNNAITKLGGDFLITGIHTVDVGNNIIHNAGTPVVATDVANKLYVDDSISVLSGPDGTLVSGVFNGITGTLTLTSTVGTPVVITGMTSSIHDHLDDEIFHNIRAPNTTAENAFRRALSTPSQPKVSVSDILDYVGNQIYQYNHRNDRYVTPVVNYTITDTTVAHANLTVTGVTTGASGTITIAGGDYTTTFKAGIQFTIYDNIGAGGAGTTILLTTVSSTYNIGPNNTVITTVNVPISTTADGTIQNLTGTFRIVGDKTLLFNSSVIRFEVVGNIGGANGTFIGNKATYTGSNTWIYLASTTPLPVGATANGTIQPYTFLLPFNFISEANKVMVFDNGIKQYKSSRGEAAIQPIIGIFPPNASSNTTLTNGTYSFNMAIDGGANNLIAITVNHTSYTVVGVDESNKKLTISGNHVSDFFEFEHLHLTGNTGITNTTVYTIISAALVSGNTEITVANFPVSGITADGSLRQPYDYIHLVTDLTVAVSAAVSTAAILYFEDGRIILMSNTVGATSQISLTDVSLVAALPNSTISNGSVGVAYSYSDLGIPSYSINAVDFVNLPTIGNTLEFINNR